MSLLPFDVSRQELVGVWVADIYDGELVLGDDSTFSLTGIPVGYTDISEIDPLHPDTANQPRVSLSGTWTLEDDDELKDTGDERGNKVTLWPEGSASIDHVEVFLWGRLLGDLDHLYLIQGDPDSGDYLEFFKRQKEEGG